MSGISLYHRARSRSWEMWAMPRKHVLIVDDEPSALEAVEAALCKEFRVSLAPV